MIEMTKKLDLAKCTLGVHVIIKGVGYLLHRHKLVRLRIQHRASPIPIYKKKYQNSDLSRNKKISEHTKRCRMRPDRLEQSEDGTWM